MKNGAVRWVALLGLGLMIALGGIGCDDSEVIRENPVREPLPVARKALFDEAGREIVLRGVNARISGVFDVNFEDGREPLEHIPDFTGEDTDAMQRIGFNLLRLPINWSGIEPEPGIYDQAYLARIGEILDLCAEAGIRVLLDMHQDAYSKEIGEDGAPLWAISPAPEKTNEGGELGNLLALRLSKQTQQAFVSFWRNDPVQGRGLQDHFIDAMLQVVKRFKDHKGFWGIEIFNEPWLLHTNTILEIFYKTPTDPPLTTDDLYAFYQRAVEKIRAAAPDIPIVFEPDVAKNTPPAIPPGATDQPPYAGAVPSFIPWNPENTVYGPHFYISAFFEKKEGEPASGYGVKPDNPEISLHLSNSIREAEAFEAPLFIGEFGFTDKAPGYRDVMDAVFDIMDRNVIHTAQWLWKENSQDAWGFYDFDEAGTPKLREKAAADTARPYPEAISGRIREFFFDRAQKTLTIDFYYADTGASHRIFVPVNYGFENGFTAACNGKVIQTRNVNDFGRIEAECGEFYGEECRLTITAE